MRVFHENFLICFLSFCNSFSQSPRKPHFGLLLQHLLLLIHWTSLLKKQWNKSGKLIIVVESLNGYNYSEFSSRGLTLQVFLCLFSIFPWLFTNFSKEETENVKCSLRSLASSASALPGLHYSQATGPFGTREVSFASTKLFFSRFFCFSRQRALKKTRNIFSNSWNWRV